MYALMKLMQPVAEQIGTVLNCKCVIRDRKFYDYDEVVIDGVTPSGRPFVLTLEVKDEDS